MTLEKLFWKDPYMTACDATVTSVDCDRITLDRTVAYAFEGGQQSDSGSISGHDIMLAERDGKQIYYTLPQNHGLKAGDTVRVEIDWDKRYRIMKLHFAAELVLELVYQLYEHPYKSGANITDEKARLDFVWEGNIADIFPRLETELDKLINPGVDIISAFEDKETERRFWQIEGFAKVPCGGTHIRNTSEIGRLRLKRVNPGKGKERIEISLCQ